MPTSTGVPTEAFSSGALPMNQRGVLMSTFAGDRIPTSAPLPEPSQALSVLV